jgi:ATP-dependent helicase HrpA
LVPGLLKEKVVALLKTLPQKYRHRLQPLDAFAEEFCEQPHERNEMLVRALSRSVEEALAMKLPLDAFRPGELRPHLSMNFRLIDEHGATLTFSRSLSELRNQYSERVERLFAQSVATAPINTSNASAEAGAEALTGLTEWSFGNLPELVEIKVAGKMTMGFAALVDDSVSVSLRAFDTEDKAREMHRAGLRRLFALALKEQVKSIDKGLPGMRELAMQFMAMGTERELKDQLLATTLNRVCMSTPLPTNRGEFEARVAAVKPRFVLVANEIMRLVGAILTEQLALQKKLAAAQKVFGLAYADIAAQMERLLVKGFIVVTDYERLSQYPRYLKAANLRLEKMRADAARDSRLMGEWQTVAKPFEREYMQQLRNGGAEPFMQEFRWLLEELRVTLFAQELRTPSPVSVKRLQKMWDGRPR